MKDINVAAYEFRKDIYYSRSTVIQFFQCYILFGLCVLVSGNIDIRMSMSIDRSQATFKESLTISCFIKTATECTQLAWLYGIPVNSVLQWKLLSRRDIPYTNQYEPSLSKDTDEITYKMKILQLQPDDVAAWLRCECNEHNNVSKRLIQINDKLIVNPAIFDSTFETLQMILNVTTIISNVYPEPGNCSLSINQNHVVTCTRMYNPLVADQVLVNATYIGFAAIPTNPCQQNVTVTCSIGDRLIIKTYPLNKMYKDQTCEESTFSVGNYSISLIIFLLSVFIVAVVVIKYIRTYKGTAYVDVEKQPGNLDWRVNPIYEGQVQMHWD